MTVSTAAPSLPSTLRLGAVDLTVRELDPALHEDVDARPAGRHAGL